MALLDPFRAAPAQSFPVIESAGRAYLFLWTERVYLLNLILAPFLVKLVCHVFVIHFGWQENFIRQSLVMLPSYFADGWMCAHLVRLIFLGQRWPFRPTGNIEKDRATLVDRAQGVMAGTVCFVTIKMLMTGYVTGIYAATEKVQTMIESNPNVAFFSAVVLIATTLMTFHLLWLYIPASFGYSLRHFIKQAMGFRKGIQIVGLWLITFLPVLFVFGMISSLLAAPFEGQDMPASLGFVFSVLRVMADTAVGILATAGFCYCFYKTMTGKDYAVKEKT